METEFALEKIKMKCMSDKSKLVSAIEALPETSFERKYFYSTSFSTPTKVDAFVRRRASFQSFSQKVKTSQSKTNMKPQFNRDYVDETTIYMPCPRDWKHKNNNDIQHLSATINASVKASVGELFVQESKALETEEAQQSDEYFTIHEPLLDRNLMKMLLTAKAQQDEEENFADTNFALAHYY